MATNTDKYFADKYSEDFITAKNEIDNFKLDYEDFFKKNNKYNSAPEVRRRNMIAAKQEYYKGIDRMFLRAVTDGRPAGALRGLAMVAGVALFNPDYFKHLRQAHAKGKYNKMEKSWEKFDSQADKFDKKCSLYSSMIKERKLKGQDTTDLEDKLLKFTEKREAAQGKKDRMAKKFAKVERLANGGRNCWNPRSAAIAQFSFAKQAFDDMRTKGEFTDTNEILNHYKDAVSELHRQCTEDGVDMKLLSSSLGNLLQNGHDDALAEIELYQKERMKALQDGDTDRADALNRSAMKVFDPYEMFNETSSFSDIDPAKKIHNVIHTTDKDGKPHTESFYINSGEFSKDGKPVNTCYFEPRMPWSSGELMKNVYKRVINTSANPIYGVDRGRNVDPSGINKFMTDIFSSFAYGKNLEGETTPSAICGDGIWQFVKDMNLNTTSDDSQRIADGFKSILGAWGDTHISDPALREEWFDELEEKYEACTKWFGNGQPNHGGYDTFGAEDGPEY